MPPRVTSRNEDLSSLGDKGHGFEFRRTSRNHQTSRFAREKTLSPRVSQSLKFKDKGVKAENPLRPPYADVPLEFVKNASNGYLVQAKYSGNQQQSDEVRKNVSNEDELIKYMSKVPGYLQKGEKLQDSVLNFGVLDWGRLEKWTLNQSQSSTSGTCSLVSSSKIEASNRLRQQFVGSHVDKAPIPDFSPVVRPLKGKVINHPDEVTMNSLRNKPKESNGRDRLRVVEGVNLKSAKPKEKDQIWERHREDKSVVRVVNLKSAKGKEKCFTQDNAYVTNIPSSKLSNQDGEVLESSKKKPNNQDAQPQKHSNNFERLDLDISSQHYSGKQESIILLLPKDFSRPSSSEVSEKASPHGKSSQHNWGSFSDIFSVDEIPTNESFSDIPHSLNQTVETETDLDVKLDTLIKAQGVELPVKPADTAHQSNGNNTKTESVTSTVNGAGNGLDRTTPRYSVEMNRESSRHQRFASGLARMTRSLSFKEGSIHPPLSSMHVTAKSGPFKPENSAFETSNSSASNVSARARASPLRRWLDPILKYKVVNQTKEHSNDLRMKPAIPVVLSEFEKVEVSTVKAFLHLTVKSGLPLFKFVVESNNEILASTVKSVSPFGKDDTSLLYTFYSVHQVRKKSGGWKNQKVKPCGFGYNVVGQMKVSKPHLPSWCDQNSAERSKVKESVLYSVDVNKSDAASSELKTGRELATIVVNMPNETGKYECDLKDENLAHAVVILPGGDHSLPHEGVPSSLINRWRTGGLCDCGGWDEGCKLRILTDMEDLRKAQKHSRYGHMELRCDLYDQGESMQSSPFFRLTPFRDGLSSVEFDAKLSCLQAFSICVGLINSKQPTLSSDPSCAADQAHSKQEISQGRPSVISGEDPDKKTHPHPPLSPVGRV